MSKQLNLSLTYEEAETLRTALFCAESMSEYYVMEKEDGSIVVNPFMQKYMAERQAAYRELRERVTALEMSTWKLPTTSKEQST